MEVGFGFVPSGDFGLENGLITISGLVTACGDVGVNDAEFVVGMIPASLSFSSCCCFASLSASKTAGGFQSCERIMGAGPEEGWS